MIPTKIVAMQERVKIGKYYLTFLVTDTGAYTVDMLAHMLGFTKDTIIKRISLYGVFNPLVLSRDPVPRGQTAASVVVMGPTRLKPKHVYTVKASVPTSSIREVLLFDRTTYCIRNGRECEQYSECQDARCATLFNVASEPWTKPKGKADCYRQRAVRGFRGLPSHHAQTCSINL